MKTEKRHAKVGERVIITSPFGDEEETYEKGDVFVVNKVFDYKQFDFGAVLVDGMKPYPGNHHGYLALREYEVIIGEETEE